MVVNGQLDYLKSDLIPKLNQMKNKVQKRNNWLECEERNRHQKEVFEVENDHIQMLIQKEVDRTEA